MITESRQRGVFGSFIAVAEQNPHLWWSAFCTANALHVHLKLRSEFVRKNYDFVWAFSWAELTDSEYLPVYDKLCGMARDLWNRELEDCQRGVA